MIGELKVESCICQGGGRVNKCDRLGSDDLTATRMSPVPEWCLREYLEWSEPPCEAAVSVLFT